MCPRKPHGHALPVRTRPFHFIYYLQYAHMRILLYMPASGFMAPLSCGVKVAGPPQIIRTCLQSAYLTRDAEFLIFTDCCIPESLIIMPTYEYVCQKCSHEFEKFQSIKDEPLKRCPECRGKVVRKIGTGAGLLFKGSGFYITDYRSEGYKKAAKADAAPSTASSTSTSTGSTDKTAASKKPAATSTTS
jgi:putative FmdB family regulatory protein